MGVKVFFEDEYNAGEAAVAAYRTIRRHFPADDLVVVSAGDFRSDGHFSGIDAEKRAQEQKAAGADMVLSLPAASALGGYGKKMFASVALVQRLHAADTLILPCRPLKGQSKEECASGLRETAMRMFREVPGYREKLKENLRRGMPFQEARLMAAADGIPELSALLAYPENRQAVSILDAMLQLYYMKDVFFMEAEPDDEEDRFVHCKVAECGSGAAFQRKAADEVCTFLNTASVSEMMDIFGSTEEIVESLKYHRKEIETAEEFEQIVALISGERDGAKAYLSVGRDEAATSDIRRPNRDAVRLYLMRAILGIRHSTMQIAGLHLYTPYCRLLAMNEEKSELINALRDSSWVPILVEGEPVPSEAEKYSYLIRSDERAKKMY